MEKLLIMNSSSFGRIYPEHMQRLENIVDVKRLDVPTTMHGKELADAVGDATYIIASVTPFFDQEFFEYKKDLKIISRHGIGYNNVDIEAAKKCGTLVSIVPPLVERDAVAENAVANLLALMRKTIPADEAAHHDEWVKRAKFMGNGLSNKTAGIIGCGNIGTRVAEILKYGFNCKVIAYDPNPRNEWASKHGIEYVDLETLLKESDVISLNALLDETSYHILNTETIAQLKEGVYITNTARGDLIDEDAMIQAIESKRVRGYAADCLHKEPIEKDHPFLNYENVIVTPHTSAYTYECIHGMGEKCVSDIEEVVNGNKPSHCVE